MASLSEIGGLSEALPDADVLLIVPPFHVLKHPSMGVHLLQACGREAGFRVRVLYANILLASMIGEETYAKISSAPVGSFAGERFFARCAFGLPPLGRRSGRMFEADWVIGPHKDWEVKPEFECYDCKQPITLRELRGWERCAGGYVDTLARAVSKRPYRIVGCSTTFLQTAASVALLNRIKMLDNSTVTILGGANCEGEMGRGIASLPSGIDYIFSGECEVAFPRFVRAILAGQRPQGRVLCGQPCKNLDALPTPSYAEFYEQRKRFLPGSKLPSEQTKIPYQASRGCWWGQKHHCTFCGQNGGTITFRQKSPDRFVEDLRSLLVNHPTRRLIMTDNIMPHQYFRSLLPRLAAEFPPLDIFYATKANLSLPNVLALKRAGITCIQPGIESLSTRLLTLMKKGVQARQNLMLLRYARAAGVGLDWGLLWGFPGDDVEAYKEILAILPLLHHLPPPYGMVHLNIDRFSPYHSEPTEFGVRNTKPLDGYYDFLPKGAEIDRIAYHFTATYRSGAHNHVDVIQKLWRATRRWQAAWGKEGSPPNEDLKLIRRPGSYVLMDTRHLGRKSRSYSLEEDEASNLVSTRPCSGAALEAWAVREKLALFTDGWFVPLAVAEPEILLELTKEPDPGRSGLPPDSSSNVEQVPETWKRETHVAVGT